MLAFSSIYAFVGLTSTRNYINQASIKGCYQHYQQKNTDKSRYVEFWLEWPTQDATLQTPQRQLLVGIQKPRILNMKTKKTFTQSNNVDLSPLGRFQKSPMCDLQQYIFSWVAAKKDFQAGSLAAASCTLGFFPAAASNHSAW